MTWDISTSQASCKLTCQAYQETCEARFNGWSERKHGLNMGQPGSIYQRDELGWRWQEPSFRGGTMVVHYGPSLEVYLSTMEDVGPQRHALDCQFGPPPSRPIWSSKSSIPESRSVIGPSTQTACRCRDLMGPIPNSPYKTRWKIHHDSTMWINVDHRGFPMDFHSAIAAIARNFDPCLGLNRNGAINQLVALNPVQK